MDPILCCGLWVSFCHFYAQLSLCCEKRTVVYMRSVPTTSRKIYQKWYIFQIVPSIFCMKQGHLATLSGPLRHVICKKKSVPPDDGQINMAHSVGSV